MDNNSQNNNLQKQIDWLNVNLKKEINSRLGDGDRYRYAIAKVDERVLRIEKRLGWGFGVLFVSMVTSIVVLCVLNNNSSEAISSLQKCGI